jgi:hypothetical protein
MKTVAPVYCDKDSNRLGAKNLRIPPFWSELVSGHERIALYQRSALITPAPSRMSTN